MGIDGLLTFLKPIVQSEHISSFSGKTLGIDAFPWLYKGCYSYVQEYQMDLSQIRISCSNFLFLMLDQFEYYNIKPIFVFDGRSLLKKSQTITKRKNVRESNKNKSDQMLEKLDKEEAKKFLARSITITEDILKEAMGVFKAKNAQFIVSPYESDSQLAKLKFEGIIDAAVTEDSDLLVYGVNTIFKLTQDGQCDYVDLSECQADEIGNESLKKFIQMSQQSKMIVCILAGCDYLPSVKGIGLKKALRYVENNDDIYEIVNKIRSQKQFSDRVPEDYEVKVFECLLIFKHATVYNPLEKKLQNLRQPNEQMNMEGIVGHPYPQYLQLKVYAGEYDAKKLTKREIPIYQIKVNTQVDEIKLKQMQIKVKEKKKKIEAIKANNDSDIQMNMIDAWRQVEREEKEKKQKKQQKIIKLQTLVNNLVEKLLGNVNQKICWLTENL